MGAIINAQPAHASAFCMTKAALSTHTIPESYVVLNDVPKLPHACVVAEAERIAAEVSLGTPPVLLIENEGALVVGRDVLDAFDRLEVLEATAEALVLSRPLGPLVPMPDAAIDELKRAFGVEYDEIWCFSQASLSLDCRTGPILSATTKSIAEIETFFA